MITHYQGSKGPVEIAKMAYPHLKSARDKLVREGFSTTRSAEIEAMSARLAELDAKGSPEPEATALEVPAEPDNPRIHLGANNPPEATPFEAVRVHIEDLLTEAHNWADGTVVETQAQADEASRLIDDLRKAAKTADELRVTENEVFDKGKAAVQAKYAPLIADPKTKNPGKVWKAIDALKATVQPFLAKLEADRLAAAEAARRAAEEAQRVATEAARAALASDLGAQEAAEELVFAAKEADAQARRIENARSQARGGERAMGLRSYWSPELTDPKVALLHYVKIDPEAVKTFLLTLAKADVQRGLRTIPGFIVNEEKRVA